MSGRRLSALFLIVLLGAALLFGIPAPLARSLASAMLNVLTDGKTTMQRLQFGVGRISIDGLHMERHGETIFNAEHLDVSYHLRDIFPGGKQRWGLIGFSIDRPFARLVREPDGTFDIPSLLTRLYLSREGSSSYGPPWHFIGSIREGRLSLIDPRRRFAASRELNIDRIDAHLNVDSRALTHYNAHAYFEDGVPQPLKLIGTIDRTHGFAIHHLTMRSLTLPAIVNYIINSTSSVILEGNAHNIDIRAYAPNLPVSGSTLYHCSGDTDIIGVTLHIAGFRKPLRRIHGRLDLFDDGIVLRDVEATIADVGIHAAGGIYGISRPMFSLRASSDGTLEKLRSVFTFSRRYPVRGKAHLQVLLEGMVSNPFALVSFSAPHIAYDQFPIDDVRGKVTYYRRGVDIMPAVGKYGGTTLTTDGHIRLTGNDRVRLEIEADASAANIPYAAQLLPEAHVHGNILFFGSPSALTSYAILTGSHKRDTLLALGHLDALGRGAFSPLSVTRSDGSSLVGAFYLDRPKSTSAFWLAARDYRFSENPLMHAFPGLSHLTIPDFTGVLSGTAGGAGTPSSFELMGQISGQDLQTGPLRMQELHVTLGGTPKNVHLHNARASGKWGEFTGIGGYAGNKLALAGTYQGSLEQLQAFTGELGAHGRVSVPTDLLIDRQRFVVQVRDTAVSGTSVRGVPVERIAGTIDIRNRHMRIDGARLNVAGGTLLAVGEPAGARGVGISAMGMSAHSLGFALQAGTLSTIGDFGYEHTVRFHGGILLDRAVYTGRHVQADADVDVRGNTATLTRSEASLAGTYGVVDGQLSGIGTRDPAYDLSLSVRAADIGMVASLFGQDRKELDGTMDANVRITNRGTVPLVRGQVRIPEGSVNGLRFQDATADVILHPTSAGVRAGSVTIGSTHVTFSAGMLKNEVWLRMFAPQTDLADFNDFFDEGNTLGGKGRIALNFYKDLKKNVPEIDTQGNITINDLHYRSFALGNAAANWQTKDTTVAGEAVFGGTSGRLHVSGSVLLTRNNSLRVMFTRSHYNIATTLQGLDLGVWLPTLGYRFPLAGRVDADAIVRGRYPNLLIAGTASMRNGNIERYPIDHFDITVNSSGKRTMITGMELKLPSLEIAGNGSFGLRASDPITLDAHASSSDIGAILTRAIARGRTVFGRLEADMHVAGTEEHPSIAGSFDVEHAGIRGVAVSHVIGSLALNGYNLAIHTAEIDFAKGSLSLAGALPLTGSPPGIGPGKARVSLELAAHRIDLSAFQPLLPLTSSIAGILDGGLSVAGTASVPQLSGKLTLNNGALTTPYERVPLRNITARVSLGKKKIHLTMLRADAGNGTLDAHGTMTISDLMQLVGDAAYAITVHAKQAQLDFPAYGNGTIDGILTLEHTPRELPIVHGSLTLNDAVIPFSALYHPNATIGVNPPPGIDATFAVHAVAAHDVRVRSPNMNIGASGEIAVNGTLSAPKLNGMFRAGSGTLSYFNRVFHLVDGTVTFKPELGIIPLMNARASTNVFDPNSYTGSSDIMLTVSGPVTNLTIELDSDPSYDRQQILALLLNEPQVGALVGSSLNARTTAGNQFMSAEAFSVINAQFTQALLAPLETAFGQALGLTNLNVDFDYSGEVNLTARKLLGKQVNAVYASDVSYPYRQSFGFELKPNRYTSARMTFYQTLGQTGLGLMNTTNISLETNQVLLSQPLSGTNGFSFTFLQYLK
jgi:TamB, inner membrane protein subunit of TAM complex